MFQTHYLKVTFRINENILHLYFISTLKPIYNSITSGLNFHIPGRFLFNSGASPGFSKLQDTSLLYILPTLLLGSMHFQFLSFCIFFYYFCHHLAHLFMLCVVCLYPVCHKVLCQINSTKHGSESERIWNVLFFKTKQYYFSPYSSIIFPHNDTYFQRT